MLERKFPLRKSLFLDTATYLEIRIAQIQAILAIRTELERRKSVETTAGTTKVNVSAFAPSLDTLQ